MSVLLCVLSLLLSHCSLSVSTNVSNAAETAVIDACSLHVQAIYMCQQCMPGAVLEATWHES